MAGVNPATGRFDPYYYGPNGNAGVVVSAPIVTSTQSGIPQSQWSAAVTAATGGGIPNPSAPAPAPKPAAAPAAAKYVVQVGTRRGMGGLIETVQYWSDGSVTVLDSYRDTTARDSVAAMFRAAGLGEAFVNQLMAVVDGVYATNVMPTDSQVLNAIYNSDAYKKRFAGNEEIRKRMANGNGRPGDRLLTPKEYIDLEESYRTVLQDAEMPAGFWDSTDDFTKLIANGVSVGELKERVDVGYEVLNNADDGTRKALADYYNLTPGELVAYLLDPTKAQPILMGKGNSAGLNSRTALTRAYRAAELGGLADRMGEDASQGLNEEIVGLDMTEQARSAFGNAGRQADDVRRLGSLYGDTALDFEGLVRENLNLSGGAEVGRKRKKLASKERAAFGGQSAIDRKSLARQRDV
jgi:hypothetical protein